MAKELMGFGVDFLKQVKALFENTDIEEVEIEEGENLYLRVSRKKEEVQPVMTQMVAPTMTHAVSAPQAIATPAASSAAPAAPKVEADAYSDESKYHKIKSPIVGTYYERPSPDSPSFVKNGDTVSPDTSVCIIEAMKVMNEIKAEVKGKIVQILKSDGASVQANEVIMVIQKS